MTIRKGSRLALLIMIGGSLLMVAYSNNRTYGYEPAKLPQAPFYTQERICSGVTVRTSATVQSAAMVAACTRIDQMLTAMPVIRMNLAAWGVELHVLGQRDATTMLPELAHFRTEAFIDAQGHATDIDQRARGLGGFFTVCSEENLLGLKNDRHNDGSDICIHEFAHTIMDVGFDASLHNAVLSQYEYAMRIGLWRGAYASTNVREYWADLSMWYFGSHGNRPPNYPTMPSGPAALQDYDPAGFALLAAIYGGRRQPETVSITVPSHVGPDEGSKADGGPARLLLFNASMLPLLLFWIAPNGERRGQYPIMDPFRPELQNSFIGHVWAVTRPDGTEVGRYRIDSKTERLLIDPK